MVSEDLIIAFKNTDYHVLGNEHFVLNVDVYSENLQRLHEEHKAKSSAFLTAHCPLSKPLSLDENEILQSQLEADLNSSNLQFINGYGQGRGEYTNWKERSFLVLKISLEEAAKLAKKYEQYAFLWNEQKCTPKLIINF